MKQQNNTVIHFTKHLSVLALIFGMMACGSSSISTEQITLPPYSLTDGLTHDRGNQVLSMSQFFLQYSKVAIQPSEDSIEIIIYQFLATPIINDELSPIQFRLISQHKKYTSASIDYIDPLGCLTRLTTIDVDSQERLELCITHEEFVRDSLSQKQIDTIESALNQTKTYTVSTIEPSVVCYETQALSDSSSYFVSPREFIQIDDQRFYSPGSALEKNKEYSCGATTYSKEYFDIFNEINDALGSVVATYLDE